MKSRKGLLVLAAVLFGGLFFAFRNIAGSGTTGGDNSLAQKQKLLATVGLLLEQEHYSPKDINDAFSKQIYTKFLDAMDGERNLFLQSDINDFKKYENTIDDEIHGGEIRFVPAVSAVYDKRAAEAMAIYTEILQKPFNFKADEEYIVNTEKLNYSANEAERKERWRKKLKYLTLERYVDMQEEREKLAKDSAKKTDTQLEAEARERVKKAMDRLFNRIKATYNEDQRFNTFINIITNEMDPHSDYFPPVEKRAFDEQMSGRFYGIGAQLSEQDGIIKIVSLVTGGPAWKAGELMVNDVIMKVAQGTEPAVDITGYAVEDAVKLIRGNKGTEVKLTVKKEDGTIKVISIIRDEIVQDEQFVRSAVVQKGKNKIGYIYLPDFYADFERQDGARCSQDVAREIKKLKAENIDGIVIDLRNNGGGSLYEVVQMVGLFIKEGPVVQVRDKSGKASPLPMPNNQTVLYDGPLAVMVNELSASASEIFAAAIQDYKRGIVIGSTSTYGKGTVQRNVPFGKPTDFFSGRTEYGAVKLTFQKFYRINGGSTQLRGVTPDVVLPDSYEYLKLREKDNPVSLPWDEIPKVSYQPVPDDFGYAASIKHAVDKVNQDKTLSLIKSNAQWLASYSEKPVPLNIDKYKDQQKAVKATVTQNSSLTKLKEEMKVEVPEMDKDKFYHNADKAKGDRYMAWLKSIKTDLYIDQSVAIVSDMIGIKSTLANK